MTELVGIGEDKYDAVEDTSSLVHGPAMTTDLESIQNAFTRGVDILVHNTIIFRKRGRPVELSCLRFFVTDSFSKSHQQVTRVWGWGETEMGKIKA